MKNLKYFIAVTLLYSFAFASGVLIAKAKYEKSPIERQQEFKRYGQYAPIYINYTHDQMLRVCEHYNLVYDFEEEECT